MAGPRSGVEVFCGGSFLHRDRQRPLPGPVRMCGRSRGGPHGADRCANGGFGHAFQSHRRVPDARGHGHGALPVPVCVRRDEHRAGRHHRDRRQLPQPDPAGWCLHRDLGGAANAGAEGVAQCAVGGGGAPGARPHPAPPGPCIRCHRSRRVVAHHRGLGDAGRGEQRQHVLIGSDILRVPAEPLARTLRLDRQPEGDVGWASVPLLCGRGRLHGASRRGAERQEWHQHRLHRGEHWDGRCGWHVDKQAVL
mmetsp:Transcript_12198/g.20629  ORF Transcript_12198/g.20629 Transcript_12198/m.20629 type:complete len:251 (+) Transcript_12198:1057-1809(+)